MSDKVAKHALRNGGTMTITVSGPSASGKSFVMDAIRSLMEKAGLRVVSSACEMGGDVESFERVTTAKVVSKEQILNSWVGRALVESDLTGPVMSYAAEMNLRTAWSVVEGSCTHKPTMDAARIRLAIAEVQGLRELMHPNLSPRAWALHGQINDDVVRNNTMALDEFLAECVIPLPAMHGMTMEPLPELLTGVSPAFRDAAIVLAGMVAGSESGETSQQFAKTILDEVKAQ